MKKLCLLRLSAIGDVCHAVTLVNRIREHWPDVELTWVVGKVEYQLLQHIPDVRFVVFDKRAGKKGLKALQEAVANDTFDALLVMQVALRANIASRFIKAKQRIGFDWKRSKELHWLFTNQRIQPQTHAHVLDGFMAFGDALGLPPMTKPDWHIALPETIHQWAKEQQSKLGEFVIISPSASKPERNWLVERYAQIAQYLSHQGKQVVLCGGPTDAEKVLAQDINKAADGICHDYVGQTSLPQLMALIGKADLVIAPDTGPAHMATTAGTPVIGLYAHSNPRRTGPYKDQHRVVSVYDEVIEEQTGKSWQQLPWGKRAKGSDLMARISVADVQAQVEAWLAETTSNT